MILDDEKYEKECNNYFLKSIDHEMCLQKKSSLYLFDDKRCYLNETESKPWSSTFLLT